MERLCNMTSCPLGKPFPRLAECKQCNHFSKEEMPNKGHDYYCDTRAARAESKILD